MEIKVADVAELVDARDLKSPGAAEITHVCDLTRAGNPHEADGNPAVLSNTRPPLGISQHRRSRPHVSLPSLPQKIKTHGLGPRDFVLLVRERAVGMLRPWSRRSVRRGSPLRNEASTVGDITLQELFSDELSTLLVSVLRLALTAHAGRHRTDGQEAIGALRGINAHDGAAQARFVKLSENTAGELLCGARPATVAG